MQSFIGFLFSQNCDKCVLNRSIQFIAYGAFFHEQITYVRNSKVNIDETAMSYFTIKVFF